tara:strand:- start:6466 stop:6630 length:165 start_codon:yes stop_codon:yes gene_type:complete
MLDGTLPCYIEYLRFVYNVKKKELDYIDTNGRTVEDDYKNLMTCLEVLKKEKDK